MKFDKKMQGFSLIELLVVVAIIGILAAVGTVGYSNYMNSTKERVTVANAESVLSGLKTLAAAKDTGAGCTTWATCLADVKDDIKKNPYNPTATSTIVDTNTSVPTSCTNAEAGNVYVVKGVGTTGNVTIAYCYLANGTSPTIKAMPSFDFGD